MAFPKRKRLSKKKDIQQVLYKGRKIVTSVLSLFFYGTNKPENRFTVVISRKVSKKATIRNRLRRRIISFFQKDSLKDIQGLDIVIMPRPDVLRYTRKQMYEELGKILHRLHRAIPKNTIPRS